MSLNYCQTIFAVIAYLVACIVSKFHWMRCKVYVIVLGIRVEAHSNLSIQNGVIQRARQQCYVANFFGLWLQNASRIARARCKLLIFLILRTKLHSVRYLWLHVTIVNPIYQMVGSRRKPTPLFLAFGGFTYLGKQVNNLILKVMVLWCKYKIWSYIHD